MPEETDEYVKIPVAKCDITSTIVISKDEGIKALYCGGDKKIATYLFKKDKGWTMAKAKKWIKDHKEEKTMGKDREERSYQVEMRVDDDGDKPKITGYAAVFNKLSVPIMGFREKVAPGAFANCIKNGDIRALWNHNPDFVLGRSKNGTLILREDDKGLAIEILPPDTQFARDFMETIRRKDVDQMSFAFQTVKDAWDESGKETIRTLQEVNLFDVSPTAFPAYPQTDVKVRSLFEEAGLDVNQLAVIMEKRTAVNDEDIAVVRQAIDVLNSCLPEGLGGQGAPIDEGYAERLKAKRTKWELGGNENNKEEIASGKVP